MIYDFKEARGLSYRSVSSIMTTKLQSTFTEADLSSLTLVCIPASTVQDNISRYSRFSNILCSNTGMQNGFPHISIVKEKTQSHLGGTDSAEYSYDADFFKGANVILFDDVVTRGRSMSQMKSALEQIGAYVVCAISIGRTYSDYHGDNRTPHPWSGIY
ncbi:MAG: phosphoribosyltransferase [Prevotella sp.]|nr:phosphoribosyltransferase [Prevotella sp.]